jgi:hypothetical protein
MNQPSIQLFWGEASENLATIYVRFSRPEFQSNAVPSLSGTLTGPYVDGTRTIPARFTFQSAAPGVEPLGCCRVVDPCFWDSRTPSLYRAQIEARSGDEVHRWSDIWIGIRRLGCSGADFVWNSRRWVLRAVSAPDAADRFADCRNCGASLAVSSVDAELCASASRAGVLLAVIPERVDDLLRLDDEIWNWPSLALVVLDESQLTVLPALRRRAPRLLIGQRVASLPAVTLDGVDFTVYEHRAGSPVPAWSQPPVRPVVVRQTALGAATSPSAPSCLEDARAACDALQGELACAQWISGYIL